MSEHQATLEAALTAARSAIAATPKRTKLVARPKQKPIASTGARTLAATILEVLAGLRTPTEAAQALSISLVRFYQLENRALEGLVQGCEPRPIGRRLDHSAATDKQRKECDRLKQDVARHQALLRSAQRALGVVPPPPPVKPQPGSRRKRKATVRALSMARKLRAEPALGAAIGAPTVSDVQNG